MQNTFEYTLIGKVASSILSTSAIQRYLIRFNPGHIKPILFRLGEVLSYLPDKVIKPKRFNSGRQIIN